MEQKAFKNYALTKFIQTNYQNEAYNDLLAKYIDKDFLDYDNILPYMESDYVRIIYAGKILDYSANFIIFDPEKFDSCIFLE